MGGGRTSGMAEDDALDLEAGRRLFTREAVFIRGVVDLKGLPDDDLPEVAFAGRSNVGKSSLINAALGRKALARTSNAPGRTRELNFFKLDGRLYLVDLPGYGFARAPKAVVDRWTALTRDYLRGRSTLKRVYLLIDARHGVKSSDEDVMNALDVAAVSYQITLTKIDKLTDAERVARIGETAKRVAKRPAAHPRVLATSSAKAIGVEALRAEVAALIQPR